jgi:hypothetical protein
VDGASSRRSTNSSGLAKLVSTGWPLQNDTHVWPATPRIPPERAPEVRRAVAHETKRAAANVLMF